MVENVYFYLPLTQMSSIIYTTDEFVNKTDQS